VLTVILFVCMYVCKLQVLENKELGIIYGPNRMKGMNSSGYYVTRDVVINTGRLILFRY
jgi:hypothetical protein